MIISGQVRGPRYIPNLASVSRGDGSYFFEYQLSLVGEYSIVVQLGLQAFAFSPLSPVDIIPGNSHPGSCVAMGSGLSNAEVGMVGTFDIQPRDQYGNSKFDVNDAFSGHMHHPGQNVTVPLTTWCVEADQLCYASYTVNSPGGEWKVYVSLAVTFRNGDVQPPAPIFGSPFDLVMQEAPIDAAFCSVTGTGVTNFAVSDLAGVIVTSRDRFANAVSYNAQTAVQFDVMITGPLATCSVTATAGEVVADCLTGYTAGDATTPSTSCPTGCTQVDAVAASCSGTATDPAVTCSGLTADATCSAAAGCTLNSATTETCADSPDCATAFAAAAGTAASMCPAGCTYVGATLPTSASSQPIVSLRNGQYELTWTSLESGSYDVAVSLNNVPVLNSPFIVPVDAGPTSMDHSQYVGAGLTAVVAGETATYQVLTHDAYGNRRVTAITETFVAEVMILLNGGTSFQTIQGTVVDNGDGSLTVAYPGSLTLVGSHAQYMSLGTTQAHNSPLYVSSAAIDPSTTIAEGAGLAGSFAGSPASFLVSPKDRFGNLVPNKAGDFIVGFAVASSIIDGPCWDMLPAGERASGCSSLAPIAAGTVLPYRWEYLPAPAACGGAGSCNMDLSIQTAEDCTALDPADAAADLFCLAVVLDGNPVTCTADARCQHSPSTHIAGSPYSVQVLTSDQKIQAGATFPGSPSDFDGGTTAGLMARNQFRQGIADALGLQLSATAVMSITGGRRRAQERIDAESGMMSSLGLRQLQTGTVTVTYTVESVNDLTSVFEGAGFSGSLVAGINAAGSTLPAISVADFVATAPVQLSPFPTTPIKCYATGAGTTSAMAGNPQDFGLQLVNDFLVAQQVSGPEVVLATVTETSTGNVLATSTFTDNNDGSFVMHYTVPTKGTFAMAVTVDGSPINGSPFTLVVTSSVAIANNTYLTTTPPWVGNIPAVAGVSKLFSVLPVDARGNREDHGRDMNISRLSISYTDSTGTIVALPVSSVPAGGESVYTTQLVESVAGTYVLSMILYDTDIMDAPFNLVVAAAAAARENFLLTGAGLVGAAAGQVGEIRIFARDAYLNPVTPTVAPLTYALTDTTAAAYPDLPQRCDEYPNATCCEQAQLNANVHLPHQCFIKASKLIYGMHCDTPNQEWSLGPNTPPLICDQYCIDMMECHDGGISTFDSRRMCAPMYSGQSKCTQNSDCSWVTASVPAVTYSGECQYGVCWSPTGHTQDPPLCFMGTPAQIGQTLSTTGTATTSNLANLTTGAHHVTFRDEAVGNSALVVTYNGAPIPQSPLMLAVVPGSVDPDHWYTFGQGIYQSSVGHTAEFGLYARDDFNNTVAVTTAVVSGYLDGPRLVELQLAATGGHYVASYRTDVAGNYPMHLLLGGSFNPRTDVIVKVGATSSMHTSFDRSQIAPTIAGVARNFSVFTRDAFGNSRTVGGDILNASVAYPSGWIHRTTIWDLGTGEYVMGYDSTISGDFSVGIAFGSIVLDPITGVEEPCPAFYDPRRYPAGDYFLCPGLPTWNPVAVSIVPDATIDGQITQLVDGIAGQISSFMIQGVDQYGNRAQYDPFGMADGFGAHLYKAASPRTCRAWDAAMVLCYPPAAGETSCPTAADGLNDGTATTDSQCTGTATQVATSCGTGNDASGNLCAVNANSNGCVSPNGACAFRVAYTPTCDLIATTNPEFADDPSGWPTATGAQCPAGCQHTGDLQPHNWLNRVRALCVGAATPIATSCGTGNDANGSPCALNANSNGCVASSGSCQFRAAHTPTCDLDAATNPWIATGWPAATGAQCPIGCIRTGGARESPSCVYTNPLNTPAGRCALSTIEQCTAALGLDDDGTICQTRKCIYDQEGTARIATCIETASTSVPADAAACGAVTSLTTGTCSNTFCAPCADTM